jgi:hypothetical protein
MGGTSKEWARPPQSVNHTPFLRDGQQGGRRVAAAPLLDYGVLSP